MLLLVASLALLVLGLTSLVSPAPSRAATGHSVYLPSVSAAAAVPWSSLGCQAIPGASFSSIPIVPPPTNPPAAQHPDINLDLRGWLQTSSTLGLVTYNSGGGGPDPNAPQLASLFVDDRVPTFSHVYQVYNWNWTTNTRGTVDTDWPVTLAGMAVSPGEIINLPSSGYRIYQNVYQAMVLYATQDQITLKYTRDDNVVYGYTIHVDGVCVEPSLLALYNQLNAAGRAELPALVGGQALGRANASEIQVTIRDTGVFMDPRSHNDWWQGK